VNGAETVVFDASGGRLSRVWLTAWDPVLAEHDPASAALAR